MNIPLMESFNQITGGEFSYLKLRGADYLASGKVVILDLIFPESKLNEAFTAEERITEGFKKVWDSALPFKIKLTRSHFDKEFFKQDLALFFKGYPAIAAALEFTVIDINADVRPVTLSIGFPLSVHGYFFERGADKALTAFLAQNFCDEITVSYAALPDVDFTEGAEPPQSSAERLQERAIKLRLTEKYAGEIPGEKADYICDVKSPRPYAVLAGTLIYWDKREKKNKTGDPVKDSFFRFELNDTTGRISGVMFPNKTTYPKLSALAAGAQVVAGGEVAADSFRPGTLSFKPRSLALCELPDKIEAARRSKPLPASYKTIAPRPVTDVAQVDFFSGERVLHPYILEHDFVVYDFETTGLSPVSDMITEIGAVKISGGKICEEFSTFINPRRKIPEKVVELTGITDADVANAPEIADVLPDFYKFSHGCVLVAHNGEFDYAFLARFGNAEGYDFNNPRLDTFILARRYIPGLPHYDLKSVLNALGITNEQAHRAVHDARATASAFLEMGYRGKGQEF